MLNEILNALFFCAVLHNKETKRECLYNMTRFLSAYNLSIRLMNAF